MFRASETFLILSKKVRVNYFSALKVLTDTDGYQRGGDWAHGQRKVKGIKKYKLAVIK